MFLEITIIVAMITGLVWFFGVPGERILSFYIALIGFGIICGTIGFFAALWMKLLGW